MVALRKYLNRSSKSDKIDSLTLAKMPFIDPEKLEEIYFPPGKIYAIQRLARQRRRLENEIAGRKKRIGSIVDGYFPGIRSAFSDPWSAHARAFLRSRLNPLAVVRAGEKALHTFLTKTRKHCKVDAFVESHGVYLTCREVATLYKASSSVGTIDADFFSALQDEVSRELRLMEMEEAESAAIAKRSVSPVSGGGWRMKLRVARRESGPLSMDISRAYEAHFQIPGQPTPGLSSVPV